MLVQSTSRSYRFIKDDEKTPRTINKKRTDEAIEKIDKGIADIGEAMFMLAQSDNYDIYDLLREHLFEDTNIDWSDGRSWTLMTIRENVDKLRDLLTHQDDFTEVENSVTLSDIGYSAEIGVRNAGIWTKTISSDDSVEVVEEIILFPAEGGDPVRRLRTIYWEKTDYGLSSSKIIYKTIPIGKKLGKVVAATKASFVKAMTGVR